jgi:hypothetical protein
MRLLDTRPQVLGADVEEKLAEMGRTPRFGRIFEHFAALVRDSRGDPAGAWETFEGEMAAATALGRELEQADREIEAAIADRRRRDALDLIEAAIGRACWPGSAWRSRTSIARPAKC